MQCQQCDSTLPEDADLCPECGAPSATARPIVPEEWQRPGKRSDRTARARLRTGIIFALVIGSIPVLIAGAAFVLLFFVPMNRSTTLAPAVSVQPTSTPSVEATVPETPEAAKAAAERAVTAFYEALDSGQPTAAVAALLTTDTKPPVGKGALKVWTQTTFTIVRSTLDGNVSHVYGRESTRTLGSSARGVKFTLLRRSGAWLIDSWQAVDEATVNGAMPSTVAAPGTLSETTARDVVSSLLKARQAGDAETIRLLTTAAFQKAHAAAWLDGVDNSSTFTGFTIRRVKPSGKSYVVTVREAWISDPRTATYRVIESAGAVLVDAWTSK